ncbi:hypothetical protein [Vibrio sp. SCSIO 43137]|uniref:hypothetical protein n=1 Tax=Vibrio sp. SCSIO 43137 TaxID=3021011 RepID=UPI0023075F6F|nr:hypothetical protein [Vibrio sp. SCSIO 43137]WCE31109.1 hypothetical protein PK654_07545 [Vibrio sp. SCSIO 43137]
MMDLTGAFGALESASGGAAGPSGAYGGYHDSSFVLNPVLNMAQPKSAINWPLIAVAALGVAAYLYKK